MFNSGKKSLEVAFELGCSDWILAKDASLLRKTLLKVFSLTKLLFSDIKIKGLLAPVLPGRMV